MTDEEFKEFRSTRRWHTVDGRVYLICDLTDKHLANIINYVLTHSSYYKQSTVGWLHKEAEFRGLTIEFLEQAPYEYTEYDVSKPNT